MIWIDSKNFPIGINYKNIKKLIENNPDANIFSILHPHRKTTQEELVITIKLKVENINNANIFLDKIKNINLTTPLPDTTLIIRKNNKITNSLFQNIFDLLKIHGLKRDQNIYNYSIHDTNYDKELIKFVHRKEIF